MSTICKPKIVENQKLQKVVITMSMQAVDLGLPRQSLLTKTHGKELLYHLRLVPEGEHLRVRDVVVSKVRDNDDCRIYHKGQLLAITSTQELGMLIKAATLETFAMVKVQTQEQMFYAAVDESLLVKEYIGLLTDSEGRVDAFVQEVNGTYWAQNGRRLIHLDFSPEEKARKLLNAQESLRYVNKYPEEFRNAFNSMVLFKGGSS